MRTLVFYGVSDDLFELQGTQGEEPDEISPGCVDVIDEHGNGLRVYCDYAVALNVCWVVGIAPLEEDVPIPAWPVTFKLGGRGYSTEMTLEVPDSAIVTRAEEPTE